MKRRVCCLGLALAMTAPGLAGAAWAGNTPAWVRRHAAAAVPAAAQSADGVILFRDTRLTVRRNGRWRLWQRRVYRVLQPQGAWLATQDTVVDHDTQLKRFRGWERLPGGKWERWRRRDATWINPLMAFPGYVRYRLVELSLPDPPPGTLLAFEIRRRVRPEILQHIWRFQHQYPDLDARLTVRLPPGWRALAHWRHWPSQPGQEGPDQRQWVLRGVPGLPSQPAMPPQESIAGAMSLTLAPPSPLPALSPLSAQATGAWFQRLTAGRTAPTAAVRAQAAALVAGQRTLAGKIAAVARYVQQRIRYAAVEVGLGGYQPHAAATVLANGYGDCKDKATLLIAMLRTLGVRADYVLLNAERGIVPRGYASPKSFDHAIVAIRWPAQTAASDLYAWLGASGPGHLLLFDPTDPATPWGWLPAAEQGGEALLVSHAGGRSVQLPVLASALNRRLRSARFVMRGDGSLLGSVEEVRTGVFAGRMHGQMDPTPRQQRRWQVRFDRVLPGIQLADWNGTQDGGTVLVRYRLTVRPYLQLSGTTVVLPPWLFPLATPSLQEDGARRYPIRLGTVGSRTDFYRIQLARNLQVGALPSPVNLVLAAPSVAGSSAPNVAPPDAQPDSAPDASYSSRVWLTQTPSGPVLHVQRTLAINAFTVPAARYAAVRRFWQAVRRDQGRLLFGGLAAAKPAPPSGH